MTLSAKLSRLQALKADKGQQPVTSATDLQQRLARIDRTRLPGGSKLQQQKSAEERLARQLKGYPVSEGLIRIYRRIPLHGCMGRYPLSLLQQQPRLPGEAAMANHRHVYFDTETTGLSGGSGTLAFLFGFATIEPESLQLTQYLITRFAGETAMLEAINGILGIEDRLVSYNGKSYDLPLMKTRYRMHDMPAQLDQLPHLDLLHPIRRLFRNTWPDCRLVTLEQRLLGLQRLNDLPGSEAPQAWFDFIRAGRTARLAGVVEHNLQDILSLAMTHVALTQVIDQPERHGVDIAALARWQADHDTRAAYALLKRHRHTLPLSGKRLLGRLARRFGDWGLATETWDALSQMGCRSATEQLAKYYEHISRDLKRAQHYCERLPIDADQQRRLNRIVNKLYVQEMQPLLHP
ncbi:ribonuclease H-like domain-containing protein [Candidatus Thiodiazotropha sp. CDECU1]|uniref:ribonuclease H-like domain-containing protein n=1 Tax=Candidatus Thiodiazotropha sp. CDECU1 TaxID=3065865 RepID=UPI00292E5CFC|nr:ribonuclease H-like domain-containing protein [Candidatus Thiodiazotropha sp. CDECU1]